MNDDQKRRFILTIMIAAVLFALAFNATQRSNINSKKHYASLVIQSEGEDPQKYLKGIDFTKPVKLWHLSKGDVVIQYQTPSAPQGNFYAFLGSKPTELGIGDVGIDPETDLKVKKHMRVYVVTTEQEVLATYAAPIKDDWSTPEDETQTQGSKLQLFSTCKPCFERKQ